MFCDTELDKRVAFALLFFLGSQETLVENVVE